MMSAGLSIALRSCELRGIADMWTSEKLRGCWGDIFQMLVSSSESSGGVCLRGPVAVWDSTVVYKSAQGKARCCEGLVMEGMRN